MNTGLGDKEDAKFQSMFAIERTPTLRESLRQPGHRSDDIHLVINTHLASTMPGEIRRDAATNSARPFRKRPIASSVESTKTRLAPTAQNGREPVTARDNFTPIAHVNQWEFLSGDTELLPGITTVVTAGHPAWSSKREDQSEGRIAFS